MKCYRNKNGLLVTRNARGHEQFVWTEPMLKKMRDEFPFRRSIDVADDLGMKVSMIRKKAHDMGLHKDPEWLKSMRAKVMGVNAIFRGRSGKPRTKQKRCALNEYIKNETDEQKRARLAKSVATRKRPEVRISEHVSKCGWLSRKSPEEQLSFKEKMRAIRYKAIANGAVEKAKKTINSKSDAEKELIRMKIHVTKKRKRQKSV